MLFSFFSACARLCPKTGRTVLCAVIPTPILE